LTPVPRGAIGELYAGGDGVARGYLRRDYLTRTRFLADPFVVGAMLYKTGDRVRYGRGGDLEFCGRIDGQVKIRGFRVELGDIDATLEASPWVGEAVTVAVRKPGAEASLASFVVANDEAVRELTKSDLYRGWAEEHVADWRSLYDRTYAEPAADPAFNISGWNSSYSETRIPDDEMREWVAATTSRIAAWSPQRVLEVGCGTGLLLARLAPQTSTYVATDPSVVALDGIRELIAADPRLAHVRTLLLPADDFGDVEIDSFDTVIINSVIQYFPSIEYLLAVLNAAVAVTQAGGRVFVGDVRDLRLLEAYCASVIAHRNEVPHEADLLRRAKHRAEHEDELVVDPEFFRVLAAKTPRISHIEVLLKQGRARNELTRFRYDAVLHVEVDRTEVHTTWLDWTDDVLNLQRLEKVLHSRPAALGVRCVRNARLVGIPGLAAPNSVTLARRLPSTAAADPDDLREIAAATGYLFEAACSVESGPEYFDALFRKLDRRHDPVFVPAARPKWRRPWQSYATNPLKSKVDAYIVRCLRTELAQELPDFMIPPAISLLTALPLTPNGKVDRDALSSVENVSRRRPGYAPPQTEPQRKLCDIWATVLGVDASTIGIEDPFLDLGGDSLAHVRMVAMAKNAGLEMQIGDMLDKQTIAALAPVDLVRLDMA
jgi:SAM-dependent methyltransferase